MSMANYLWSAAEALRLQVRPAVEGNNGARDALDNSVRVLTAIANALEPAPAVETPAAFQRDEVPTDRLGGPAENAAARRSTGAAIDEFAAGLDRSGDITSQETRAALAWEKAMLDVSIARFDAVERAEAAEASDPLSIDPVLLERFLRRWTGNPKLVVQDFKLVVGGRSRQTALFNVANAKELPAALVVQRGIPGQKAGSAFLSESAQFDLLSVLHEAGMRVPRPVLVEEDETHLGAPFLIVARSPGTPALTDYWRAPDSAELAFELAREMALLHSQPVEAMAGRLPQARERYDAEGWRAELETLAAAWHASAHWPSVTMSAAIAWMRANIDCLDDRRAIVHNDMVFHNILAEDGKITAVLDWEQANIGHPGEDLGYCFPYVTPVLDWERFRSAYRAAGGPDIPERQIAYFALRAGLRLMILVMRGGRDCFENGLSRDVLVASAGAHFTQRLLHRIAGVLESVLARHG